MQFDVKLAVKRLDAEIVHSHIVSGSDGAHAVEDAFSPRLTRNRVYHDVSGGKSAMYGFSGRAHQLASVLKGEASRQGEREVSKIIGSGTSNPRLLHG